MLLSMLDEGETKRVVKINGNDKLCYFLKNLGLVEGAEVTVVSEICGNLIINVKDSRVALGKAMASKIIV